MYQQLKQFTRKLLPKHFLLRHELLFRKIYGTLFFRGDSHACNIGNRKFRNFILAESGDLLCPFCGSLPRNRRLWSIMTEDLVEYKKLLHLSPSRALYRKFKSLFPINYVATDFEGEFLAQEQFDITNLPVSDDSFDLIICYHVLEHIERDIEAMNELYRVLHQGGQMYVQTPFKSGDIYENASIKTPKERLEHFGQEDHVRIYSVTGLKKRLENAGFQVSVQTFDATPNGTYFGWKKDEVVLLCRKL